MDNPLLKEKSDKHVLECFIIPNVTTNNELCYAIITNNWITLNTYGIFVVHDNLDLNI